VIFIDSNVPMYLIGADHPLKDRARRLIEDAVVSGDVLSSSAEVLQELLHRYAVIGRREFIEPAFDALSSLTDVIYSITAADVDRARRLLATTPRLSARDALHVAVMQAHDVGRIMSFDRGFDGIPGIERIA
jgi:predicted nucleic acid-binding protein